MAALIPAKKARREVDRCFAALHKDEPAKQPAQQRPPKPRQITIEDMLTDE